MIKRILAVSLALLLCIPCLAFSALADAAYQYVSSADTNGMYMGTMADMLPAGQYSLMVALQNIPLSHTVSYLNISYSPMEFEGMPVMGFEYHDTISQDGMTAEVLIQIGYMEQADLFVVALYVDGVALPASFAFSPATVFTFAFGPHTGNILPPEGRYHMDLTFDGVTTSMPVELFYETSDNQTGFVLEFTRNNKLHTFFMIYDGDISSIGVLPSSDESSGTVTFSPIALYNGLPVLLASIGSALNSVVQFCGFVVNSLLAPGGAFSPLWPLIGMCVAFALVPVGVALIEHFRP